MIQGGSIEDEAASSTSNSLLVSLTDPTCQPGNVHSLTQQEQQKARNLNTNSKFPSQPMNRPFNKPFYLTTNHQHQYIPLSTPGQNQQYYAPLLTNPVGLNYPANYFYSTNTFSSKHSLSNYRNYIKAKKEQNMHKLWPHSVQTRPNDDQVDDEDIATKPSTEIQLEASIDSTQIEVKENKEINTKTPMCLVNELIKFNKIKHEYVLLDEIGPAHKKTFFVMLKLGIGTPEEESYQSNGTSIKKAQHQAAEQALKETKFKHPSSRPKKAIDLPIFNNKLANKNHVKNLDKKQVINPTVSLNALCMKLGLRTTYENLNASNLQNSNYTNFTSSEYKPFVYQPAHVEFKKNFNRINRFNNQNFFIMTADQPEQYFTIKLKIADQEFQAEGPTLQQARHNAASKALDFFSLIDNLNKAKEYANQMRLSSIKSTTSNCAKPDTPNETGLNNKQDQKITILARAQNSKPAETHETNDQHKSKENNEKDQTEQSEISVLHEYAYRLKKTVVFELVQESGPSHIKKFVTKCSVGTKAADESASNDYFEVVGEGNSKKSSKRNSAIEMLKTLKNSYDPEIFAKEAPKSQSNANKDSVSSTSKDEDLTKKKSRKTKAKNIVKLKKTSPDYGKGSINPITRLMQIQQAKKEPEPMFELVKKQDSNRSKNEFFMQVSLKSTSGEPLKCDGKGSTKKLAKQNAAEAMLVKLGFPAKLPSQSSLKPVLKTPSTDDTEADKSVEKNEKRVKFVEETCLILKEESNVAKGVKKLNRINKAQSNPSQLNQQRIKVYKDQLEASNQLESNKDQQEIENFRSNLDSKSMYQVYKIAFELLESVGVARADGGFYSKTAEEVLDREKTAISAKDFDDVDLEEKKSQFKILNHGKEANFKSALDYLANCMNFKCNYQSILGRDGVVNSYLKLSMLADAEKPFSGQGNTYVESSNLAALNALQYLSKMNVVK